MPALTAFLNRQSEVHSELNFYRIFECSGPELDAYRLALNSSAISAFGCSESIFPTQIRLLHLYLVFSAIYAY